MHLLNKVLICQHEKKTKNRTIILTKMYLSDKASIY